MEKPCMWPPKPLVVIDPNHGTAIHIWEKKQPCDSSWKKIDVPSYTCLLYVDTTMQYRCSVNDKIVVHRYLSRKLKLQKGLHWDYSSCTPEIQW